MGWRDEKWLAEGNWVSLTREEFEDWVNLDWEEARNMVGGIVDFYFLYDDQVYWINEITERSEKDAVRKIELSQYGENELKTVYIGSSYEEVFNYKGFNGKSFNDIFKEIYFLC